MAKCSARKTAHCGYFLLRIRSLIPLVLVLFFAIPRDARAQLNGCNIIPTTTPENSSGTFGGPGGVPAGTWFNIIFAFSSSSNTTSTITVSTSGGATFGPFQWACTQQGAIKMSFAYRTQVDNETFSAMENDAGGAGAGYAALGGPSFKADGCSCADSSASDPALSLSANTSQAASDSVGLSGDPINATTGNLFEVETDYVSPPNTRLQMLRYYNSLGLNSGGFGASWQSFYDRTVYSGTGSNFAQYTRADGRVETFSLSNGAWIADTDVSTVLTPVPPSGTQTGWQIVTSDDTIETYNLAGQFTSLTTRGGLTTTLTYNETGQLATVTGPFGQTLTFAYNASGQRSQMTDAEGGQYTYAYDSHGNLISVTYPDHTIRQYVYENISFPNALTGIIDEDGNRFATWAYDPEGRANSSQHAGGAELTTVSYSSGTSTVTNALGQQLVYKFSTLQSMPKITEIDRLATSTTAAASEKFTYDGNGYLASSTDWNGNLTNYVNNATGEPTTINEAVGTAQARTTTVTYPTTFHVPLSIVTPGLTTTFTYDSNGNRLTKTLTDTTQTIVPYSTNGTARTWTYTYGANFLLSSATGPRIDVSQVTTFAYDATGVITTITNALGQTNKITQHTAGGLPLTIVDPNGVSTALTYDNRQRLLTNTLSTSAGPLTTTVTYDNAGNLLTTTLPDGSAFTNGYDAAHRLTSVTDLFGQTINYTLDGLGDRTQVNIKNSSSTVEHQYSSTFDALGRMLKYIGAVGQATTYTYDSNGNALTVADPLSHTTQQAFDALNHLIRVIDAGSGITKTTYDPHDRPVTVVDPNSGSTTYVYDGFGDVLQQLSPDTGKTVYRYDLSGNLTQSVDATGATANYTYDALNRVLSTTYPSDPAENVSYTYDQDGHGFGIGRLTSVSDAVGTLNRSYDERGNVLSEQRTHGTATLLTSFTYDNANRIASIVYPSDWVIAYTRDAMGRITAATAQPSSNGSPQSVVSGVAYEPFGPASGLTYGNGIAETHSYDLDYRMTHLADTGIAAIQNLTYGYDAADNVLSVTDGVNSGNSQSLGYDVMNRLTSATGAYETLGYTYTSIGNRLTQTIAGATTSYTYAAHSSQLTGITTGGSTQTVGNTASGSVSSFSPAFGQVGSLAYNQRGRLASTTNASNGQLTQYVYDAFGHRLVKIGSATGITIFQYDRNGHLLEEADGQGNPQVDYIYLDDRPVATIQASNSAVYFLHDDRLGTPQMATDGAQAIAWTTTYQPFGQIGTASALIAQDLRFPGQENDFETGFYHNGFRDFVPSLGRYLQGDPIGLAGGLNAFVYGHQNPLAYSDFWGLAGSPPSNWPSPPSNIPGGPWEWSPNPQNSRGGTLQGPPSPNGGPRNTLTFDQPPTNPGGYWKTTSPSGDKQHYDTNGAPISPDQAHPSPPPSWLQFLDDLPLPPLFIIPSIFDLFQCPPGGTTA
jgi:RHS repeat-associated protein